MNHLDLFSGIGGFSLSASWVWGADHNIISFVEIDKFCQKVLAKHWPDAPCHDDIRTYKHDRTNVNLLTGGFPCQPFSVAGKQGGAEDDRYLWPQMLRIISECRPHWIIGENVAGIINMELDTVLTELENEGYTTETFVIPACAVDAPHRRERVWIVGNCQQQRLERHNNRNIPTVKTKTQRTNTWAAGFSCRRADVDDSIKAGLQGGEKTRIKYRERQKSKCKQSSGCSCSRTEWFPEPNVGRVANGVRNRVDRLKSLGNAIVPQVVVPIMRAIKEINKMDSGKGRF